MLRKRTKQIMNVDLGERAGLVWIGGKEKSDKQQGQSKGGRYAARSEACSGRGSDTATYCKIYKRGLKTPVFRP